MTMDMTSDNARMPSRSRETEEDDRSAQSEVQIVADIAVETHKPDEGGEDVLHDLRDTFRRTPSLGSRPSIRRNNSGKMGRSRPTPPQRAKSMQQPRSLGPSRSSDLSTMPTLLRSGSTRTARPGLPRANSSSARPGVARTSSSSGRPGVARTSSSSGRPGVSRTNSARGARRAMPTRTASDSLRNMRRDQIVNTPLERKESSQSLMRASGDDKSVCTISDLESCFTMDSVNIRKNQMIADPLEDGTYHETYSCAEHDDSLSHWSEHLPMAQDGVSQAGNESIATFCTLDSLRLKRLNINDVMGDQSCGDISFFSQSFSTLNTADLDIESLMGMEDDGLFELDELGESQLCDLADSDNGGNGSVACVSIENVENVE